MTTKQAGLATSISQVAGVHVAQCQHLALSTQMRQKLHLLQMPSFELMRFVAEAIERNPLLVNFSHQGGSGQDFSAVDLMDKKSAHQSPTLQQSVREQILFSFSEDRERHIAFHLSEELDENGYFNGDITLIAAQVGVSNHVVASVFHRCQNFDPPGLFACSLAECLELQLKRQELFDPVFAKMLQGLPLIAKRDFARLARLCGISQQELKSRLEVIKQLNPKPGLAFNASPLDTDAPVIIPDAFIEVQEDGQYHIILNDAVLPKLALDKSYGHIVGATKEEQQFITQCRVQALWLIHALEARAQTLRKVIAAIITIQQDFLRQGALGLKPLGLADIATATSLHESTISRTIADKYVTIRQKPGQHGPYRLHYFFSNALNRHGGGEAHAAKAIEARLVQLIETEDMPLSDARLAHLLQSQGIAIARRTIAKYRERLRIAPAHQRRYNKR